MKRLLPILLACTMLLSACSSGSTSSTSTTSTGSTSGSEQASTELAMKDTLIIAQSADPTSLDPHVGKDAASTTVHTNIYNTLIEFDADMNPVPGLAESWEALSNKDTQFNLRQGVTFHNGEAFTAEDVKFSLERAAVTPAIAHLAGFIESVEIVDDYTVIVHSTEEYAPVLNNLSTPSVAIVCKSVVEELGDDAFVNPIGTGPYKFVEWNHGENVKLESYADYFGGESLTKNLVIRTIPEAAQRTIGLETGELDIAYDILPNDKSKVEENENLVVVERPSLSVTYTMLNNESEIFSDERVRQAVRYAIDIETIVDVIVSGAGTVVPNMIAPGIFGHNDDLEPYEYDVEKAKALLAEAGVAEGTKIKFYTADTQTRIEVAQVIQAQLDTIGLDVEISILEYATFYDAIANGEHDMAIFGFVTSTGDADYAFTSLYHSASHGITGNRAFYTNTYVDDLIDDARSSIDQDERIALYEEVQEIVLEECPYIPLYVQNILIGTNKNVEGFKAFATQYHKLYNVASYE